MKTNKLKRSTTIFNKEYTVTKTNNIPVTYPSVRPWIIEFANWADKIIQSDYLAKRITYGTCAAATGTSKTMAMALLSETYPTLGTTTIVTPQTALKEQHLSDFNQLSEQEYCTKRMLIENYQSLVSAIKAEENVINGKTKKLKKNHQRIIDRLKDTSILYCDEIHRYGKSESVVSLDIIFNFCERHNLQMVFGVSATALLCEAWYKQIEKRMGISPEQAYYQRRWNLTRLEAAKQGIVTLPTVVHAFTGLEIDIEIGDFNCSPADLVNKSPAELKAMATTAWSQTVKDEDPYWLKKKLKNVDVDSDEIYSHMRSFVEERGKIAIRVMLDKKQQGKTRLVYVPRRDDADTFEEHFNKAKAKAGVTEECIVWHGDSEDYNAYNADASSVQRRLQDPSDPLTTIILVGMWKEGTDIVLDTLHDLGYNESIDRTLQVDGRLRDGGTVFKYIDMLNTKGTGNKLIEDALDAYDHIDDPKLLASLLQGASSDFKDDDIDTDQEGIFVHQDTFFDFDDPSSVDLDDILGPNAITNGAFAAGWITAIHSGETNAITIPAEAYLDPDARINLSERQKMDEFFRLMKKKTNA